MRRTTDKIDELARRAFAEEPGASASFANRLRIRLAGERAATIQRNTRILAGSIITAVAAGIAILLVFTVFVNIDFVRDVVKRSQSGTGAPSASAGLEGNTQPAANQPTVAPKHVRAPDVSDGSAVPPTNEQPKEAPPGQPKPEPRKPDEVKKPDPKPEERKPEERKPDGSVEDPKKPEESKPPEHVENPPKEAVVIATVLGKPKLLLRYAEDEKWRAFEGEELKSGVQLQARANVDLTLKSGALLRFDGEISLKEDGASLESSLIQNVLYFDNRGCKQPITVGSLKLHATLKDGAALFTEAPGALEIACLEGEVVTAAGNVSAGSMKRLTSRGLGVSKPFTPGRALADLPSRLLLREDFAKEPAGGLYAGKIADGVAIAKGDGDKVAFRYDPTLTVLPRMALRTRVHVEKAKRLQLELFEQGGNDQPWLIHLTPKQGEWVEVTVKFDDLRLREKPDARLAADTLLRNFKLYVEGDKDASLEIDWVEFVRLGPGE
jgi:hypothetical protein